MARCTLEPKTLSTYSDYFLNEPSTWLRPQKYSFLHLFDEKMAAEQEDYLFTTSRLALAAITLHERQAGQDQARVLVGALLAALGLTFLWRL